MKIMEIYSVSELCWGYEDVSINIGYINSVELFTNKEEALKYIVNTVKIRRNTFEAEFVLPEYGYESQYRIDPNGNGDYLELEKWENQIDRFQDSDFVELECFVNGGLDAIYEFQIDKNKIWNSAQGPACLGLKRR